MPVNPANRVDVVVAYNMRGMAKMGQQVRFLGRQLQMTSRQSYYAGMFISRLGYAAIGAGMAIAGGIGASIKTFAEFQQTMANTASVTQATTEEMNTLGQMGRDLAKIYPKSAIEIGKAMYAIGSAGWSATEIMLSLRAATMLSVATQSDMEKSTTYLMMALKQFNTNAKDAGKFANIMAAGIASSQLRIEWLGQALKNIGPIAKGAGQTFKDTVAILAALHDVGMTAGRAGRHLKIMFTRTIRPIGRAKDALDRLGLKLEDVSLEQNSMIEIMANLSKAGATMGDMFDIFNQRAAASGIALKSLNEKLSKYWTNLDDTQALQKMVAIQMDTLKSQAILLKNAVIDVGISFGENFEKPLRKIIATLRNATLAISEYVKNNDVLARNLVIMSALLIAIGALLVPIGMLAAGLMPLSLLAISLGIGLQTALVWILLGTAALASLAFVVAEARYAWKLFGDDIRESKIGQAIIKVAENMDKLFGKEPPKVKKWSASAEKVLKRIREDIKYINEYIKEQPEGPIGKKHFEDMMKRRTKLFEDERELLRYYGKLEEEDTKGSLARMSQMYKKHYEDLFKSIKEDIKSLFPADMIADVMANIENLETQLASKIEESIIKTQEAVKNLTRDIRSIAEVAKITATQIKDFFTSSIMGMIEGTKTFKDVWVDFCRMLVKTFVEHAMKKIVEAWFDGLDRMFSGAGGLGGGLGSIISTIFGGISGIAKIATVPIRGGTATVSSSVIPSHQMGTSRVKETGLAYVHQDETILPSWKNREQTTTSYYIQAVDAASFAALVQRNPEIIHRITQEGIERNTSLRRSIQRNI